jgi:proteasome lid subunit RPN8/RPN11
MIEIPADLRHEMVEHALREFPNEACGLLAGTFGSDGANGSVHAGVFYPMANADASSVTYRLDPKEQFDVTREVEDKGLQLVGIYHSHTHSEAYPSQTDTDRAFFVQPFYPEARYVLVSLSDRNNPVLRAFTIHDGRVEEQDVTIT